MGKIKSNKGKGKKSVTLFTFPLNQTSATILFILALFGGIGSLIAIVFVALGLMTNLSYASVAQSASQETESSAASSAYQTLSAVAITYYIVYLVVWFLVLILCVYIASKC